MRWRDFAPTGGRLIEIEYVAGLTLLRVASGRTRRARAEAVRLGLIRLGPAFIKLGQVLGTRSDILPPDACAVLAKLHDAIPPPSLDVAQRVLRQELGARADQIRLVRPLAGGSVAGVYLAHLDGRKVAVKIRRPGVANTLVRDFHLLDLAAALLERVPALAVVPIRQTVAEVREALLRQLDFSKELRAHLTILRSLRAHGVLFPAPVLSVCGNSVLVMSYLTGLQSVAAVDGLKAEERKRLASVGLQALYDMIFRTGVIHADLHPGNVGWVNSNPPQIAFLDAGLTAELSEGERASFARFFLAMAMNDGPQCAKVVLATAERVDPEIDSEAFEAEIIRLVSRHAGLAAAEFNVVRFVTDLFDVQRKFGVRASTAFHLAILSLISFEGTLRTLSPDLDFQAEARAFFLRRPS